MTAATNSDSSFALPVLDLRGRRLGSAELKAAMPRAETTFDVASQAVEEIIGSVRSRGFEALAELAQRFDGVEQSHPKVPAEALEEALAALDPAVRAGLEESIARARTFAEAQKPADAVVPIADEATVTHKWVPVARVGLYVPGGLAVYPSSVVMNAR